MVTKPSKFPQAAKALVPKEYVTDVSPQNLIDLRDNDALSELKDLGDLDDFYKKVKTPSESQLDAGSQLAVAATDDVDKDTDDDTADAELDVSKAMYCLKPPVSTLPVPSRLSSVSPCVRSPHCSAWCSALLNYPVFGCFATGHARD